MGSETHAAGKGSVLVVGGGIAGIQSSLDLADSGFKVYLVERSPAIGGTMSMIDKTFPTNDCAMCIMSPKLVDCARHLNIDLLTYSDVLSVDGEAGDFTVKILRKARFIDEERCTGCGECAEICPVTRSSEFDQGLAPRKAVFRPYPQAAPNVFTIEKAGLAPCTGACPAGCNAQGYVALIRERRFQEALDLIRQRIPLPSVCGRVCGYCEDQCNRATIDAPLRMRALKRFASDYERDSELEVSSSGETQSDTPGATGPSVAIVGSGPAGLTAAYDLAKLGYRPVVFEADAKAGGMLRVGIPSYRLPDDILDHEIGLIEREGVEIHTSSPVEATPSTFLSDGFDAVFVGIGTHASRRLGVAGEDLDGVSSGLAFLKHAATHTDDELLKGKHVAVIGGGNTAIDTVRTAIRCGADHAFIAYRRTRDQMPVSREELDAAEAEGIEIHELVSPLRIEGSNGHVTELVCQKMRLGFPDESGRRRPEPIEGETETFDVDTVFTALGQVVDDAASAELLAGIDRNRNLVAVDPVTLETSVPGVFAGGDAVGAEGFVVHAIAHGHEAAVSIDRFIRGVDLREGRAAAPSLARVDAPTGFVSRADGIEPHLQEARSRIGGFTEVETAYTEDEAVAEASRCLDCGICSQCLQCVSVCKADAIDHTMTDQEIDVQVGSIIVAAGCETYDASGVARLGYGRHPDVVTSLQFERILSASGPYAGHLRKPSDGSLPKKIAFIQCVGSRDAHAPNAHCSSVCCMYAMKEAVIAKEHEPTVEPTIFYMDIRAFGKEFERYYDRARNEYGVRFVHSRVSHVTVPDDDGRARISYESDEGVRSSESFDMVVLSVGFEGDGKLRELAGAIGLPVNSHGFIASDPAQLVETGTPGIYVCGPAQEPKDIPETVTQASSAAAAAAELLAEHRFEDIEYKTYPDERSVAGEPPRIGVFVCNCGINIGGVVDVPSVVEFATALPGVVHAEANLYTCSQDTQSHIRESIEEHRLNRVVVASCTPRTHQPLFQETLREAGINRYLFEMANIRDQCSWVHRDEPADATAKSRELVAMAVAKVALVKPLQTMKLSVHQSALVIGGGPAGMSAALSLARQKFPVTLVEKSDRLGGMMNTIRRDARGHDLAELLTQLEAAVEDEQLISVHRSSRIVAAEGFVGNFRTTIGSADGSEHKIEHGAVVLATGANESVPTVYGYGSDQRIVTGLEFEQELADGTSASFSTRTPDTSVPQSVTNSMPESVVFIQCVGSREPDHQYCSRTCCKASLKNAIQVKRRRPDADVYVLYRDIRTYGFSEELYTQARDLGVVFLRYDEHDKPIVRTDGEVTVSVRTDEASEFEIQPERVVLASRMDPADGQEQLSQLYKVPMNQDGFFLEAHAKLRPVDFSTDGVYLAGTAHGPKDIPESISQGRAAASRAAIILNAQEMETEATIADVDADVCAGCGICVDLCEYSAIEIGAARDGRRIAMVNDALCKGCGACAGACPSDAMSQKGFRHDQVLASLEAVLHAG